LTGSVKVGEIMTRRVVTSRPDYPIEAVAKLMAENHISGLPVVDESDRPIGIISERDFLEVMVGSKTANLMEIIAQCLGEGGCLMVPVKEKLAREIMSSPAVSVNVKDIVTDVAKLFTSKRINRAPVVETEEGRIVGIVTRGDLMRASTDRGPE
jgi:CBS domain-containing membrane protein